MVSAQNWLFWAALAAVFAALTTIFAKIGLQGVAADMATLVRTVMVTAAMAAVVGLSGQWTTPLAYSGRTWLFLGLSALATTLSWLCFFRALQVGQASQVALVDKSSILLVVLFAVLFLGDRPSLQEWLGIAMIAAGLLVLAIRL
jgi:bacterial/archaeal transporter family protein